MINTSPFCSTPESRQHPPLPLLKRADLRLPAHLLLLFVAAALSAACAALSWPETESTIWTASSCQRPGSAVSLLTVSAPPLCFLPRFRSNYFNRYWIPAAHLPLANANYDVSAAAAGTPSVSTDCSAAARRSAASVAAETAPARR